MNLTGLADTLWHPDSAAAGAGLAGLIVRGPERIALTGPNGAGKTTLLRAIAGRPCHRACGCGWARWSGTCRNGSTSWTTR